MNKSNKFSPEVRERSVRMVQAHRGEYPSPRAAVESIAPKIGCVPQTLPELIKRHEVDIGVRGGVPTAEAQGVEELDREVKELRRANILMLASAFFAQAALDRRLKCCTGSSTSTVPPTGSPICKVLQVAPSGYRRHAARRSYQRRLLGRSEIETRVVEADFARVHVELRRKGVTRRTGR